MENYRQLFELISYNTLLKIVTLLFADKTSFLGANEDDDKTVLIEEMIQYVESNGDYNIEALDNAIIEALDIKIVDMHHAGHPSDFHGIRVPNFYDESYKRRYAAIASPNKWNLTLSINDERYSTSFTLGCAHKEKRAMNPKTGKYEWIRYIENFPTVSKVYDLNKFLQKYEGSGGRNPKYRNRKPEALEVLDALLMDMSCIEVGYTTEEMFCEELGYTGDYQTIMKGIEVYRKIVETKRELEPILSK